MVYCFPQCSDLEGHYTVAEPLKQSWWGVDAVFRQSPQQTYSLLVPLSLQWPGCYGHNETVGRSIYLADPGLSLRSLTLGWPLRITAVNNLENSSENGLCVYFLQGLLVFFFLLFSF